MTAANSDHATKAPRRTVKLKICGVTDAPTYLMLEEEGVDYVGLWFRMPGGKHALDETRLTDILQKVRSTGKGCSAPVLVTLTAEADWLGDIVGRHALQYVQLHGFQLPQAIKRLKQQIDNLVLFKTLHVQQGTCIDERFIDAYLAAGVDAFVLDNFVSSGDVGSTGQRFDPAVFARLYERYPEVRWLFAGGITAEYAIALCKDFPKLFGIDVDSAARVGGRIDRSAVGALAASLPGHRERRAA